jgi:hypothetical protein
MRELPESVQEIADVIGREQALRLIEGLPKYRSGSPGKQCTKVMLYVPKRLKPGHLLIELIGQEGAERLVRVFGGEQLYPACCSGNVGGRPAKNPAVEAIQAGADNLATIPHGAMSMPTKARGVSAHV